MQRSMATRFSLHTAINFLYVCFDMPRVELGMHSWVVVLNGKNLYRAVGGASQRKDSRGRNVSICETNNHWLPNACPRRMHNCY